MQVSVEYTDLNSSKQIKGYNYYISLDKILISGLQNIRNDNHSEETDMVKVI